MVSGIVEISFHGGSLYKTNEISNKKAQLRGQENSIGLQLNTFEDWL